MARSDNNDANPLLWIVFLIALYISTFFMDIPELGFQGVTCFGPLPEGSTVWSHTPLSAVLAALALIVSAVFIHFLNDTYSSGLNFVLPLIYLILVIANPSALYLTPMHLAALFFILSIAAYVRFKAETCHNSDIFVAIVSLMAASCFYVPLIWMLPLFIISAIPYAEYKLRYLGATLFSIVVGSGLIMGCAYLFFGYEEMLALPGRCLDILMSPHLAHPDYSILQFVRIITVILLGIAAFFRNLRNKGYYKISEAKMLSSLMICSVLILPMLVLYLPDCRAPFGTIAFAPVSVVIFGLFGDSKKVLATVFSLIIMLTVVAERLAIYFDGWGVPFIKMLIN